MSEKVVTRKKLIEVALPLPEINDASAYDKMPGIGPHPKGIHHWWARLPLPTARAMLFASVVDDPSSNPTDFPTDELQSRKREELFSILRDLMQKKLHEHPEVYDKAQREMLKYCNGKLPSVLDPFSGGGSIPLEAARLGFRAYAFDLNPIAVLLNKCNLELVPRWLNYSPVNPEMRDQLLESSNWKGADGLVEDVRYYGRIIRSRATEKIGHLYPKIMLPKQYGAGEGKPIAWLWVRTIQCPNPGCRSRTPLLRSFWLSKNKANQCYLQPMLKDKSVTFRISKEGEAGKETTSGKGARCLFCGVSITKSEVRDSATQFGTEELPLTVVVDTGRGRAYLEAEPDSLPSIIKPVTEEIERPMTNDRRWFSPPLYGLPKFSDVFTPRQLTALLTLSDLIKGISEDVLSDAQVAGMSDKEAEEYSDTISTFLALTLDRCTDFNNSLCRWTAGNQKVMNLFGRQAIPMVWDFAEANILGDSVGAWATCSEYVADCIKVIGSSVNANGHAEQVNAAALPSNLNGFLVSTDPPYYDNIGYAVLSDFFYMWLRRTLDNRFPELFNTILVPKAQELTASPERFGGNALKAKEHFEKGFRATFTSLREKMDHRFPLTVYYAFKQEDQDTSDTDFDEKAVSGIDQTTGWETLLEALVGSGFQITATWPVRASQKWRMVAMGTNALASYIILACRVRSVDSISCSRREFVSLLKRELPSALKYLQQGNIAPVDLAQASIGPGMAIFSRYSEVTDASGNQIGVREALGLINQTLEEVLTEQEGDFDSETRWALTWFEVSGFGEGEFGDAETLSKAKVTSIEGMVEAGIITARGGKVRLLRPSELSANWDPNDKSRRAVWKDVHHLIRVFESEKSGGDEPASALALKLGTRAETARELSYRLYKVCERKKRTVEAFSYNALVQSWPEITRLARESERPVTRTTTDMFKKEL